MQVRSQRRSDPERHGPRSYFSSLSHRTAETWHEFWFESPSPGPMEWLRVAIGTLALIWQLSFTPDLLRWFGPAGWLDASVYFRWVTEEADGWSARLSFLFGGSAIGLWAAHGISSVILAGFVAGLWRRYLGVLAWLVVLSYVHRAPFLCGPAESVMAMAIGYLGLAPRHIARRLIQIHLSAVYAVAVATQLIAPVWWNGEALWWINAQALNAGPHWLFLRSYPLALNLWTFAFLLAELAMCTLIWSRLLRPLVLIGSATSWLSLALLTGQLGLPLVMITASLAFAEGRQSPRERGDR